MGVVLLWGTQHWYPSQSSGYQKAMLPKQMVVLSSCEVESHMMVFSKKMLLKAWSCFTNQLSSQTMAVLM